MEYGLNEGITIEILIIPIAMILIAIGYEVIRRYFMNRNYSCKRLVKNK